MRPAKSPSLSLRELVDETVVYNSVRDEATVLDVVARGVFDACDGTREIAEIALVAGLGRDGCMAELDRLADAGLIVNVPVLRSRRALLGGAAIAGGGLTLAPLASIVLPTAAAAVSPGPVSGGTTPQLTVTRTSESCSTDYMMASHGTVQVTGSGFSPGAITITYDFYAPDAPTSVQSADGTFSFSATGEPACAPGPGNSFILSYGVTATDSAAQSKSGSAPSDCTINL